MIKLNLISKSLFAVVLLSCLTMISCSDDMNKDVSGCTDVDADNYNAEATVSDNNCVYARDKFVGAYQGDITFQTLSTINQTDITFTILENISGPNDVLFNFSIMGLPTAVPAVASGDTIYVDGVQLIPNGGAINPILEGQSIDILFSGALVLSNNDKDLDGNLDVVAKSSATGATVTSDVATINAERI